MKQHDTQFVLIIKDNGKGYNNALSTTLPTHGVKNMQQRAKEIGGILEINSTLMHGTTVKFTYPKG